MEGIPVIAICDTDTNPDKITYPIPANDDAAKAVELILQALVSLPTKEKKAPVAEDVEEKPKKTAKPKADKVTKKVAKTELKKTVKKKK